MVLAAGAMGVTLWLTQQMLFGTPPHGVARFGALAALIAVGLVAYAAAAAGFGAGDWRAVGRIVGRKIAGRTRAEATSPVIPGLATNRDEPVNLRPGLCQTAREDAERSVAMGNGGSRRSSALGSECSVATQKVLIMGASYGSLLATKLLFAGHR